MAGKSGLNLTKDEGTEAALAAYAEAAGPLGPILRAFGPAEVQDWARGLGQEVFTGSSGRVFPVAMKASPLLRAWMGRLGSLGVELRVRHKWVGWEDGGFVFETPEGRVVERPAVAVLALGGASWARLGSDGAWAPLLEARGVEVAPFAGANVGVRVDWSPQMARHFGAPVKGVELQARGKRVRAEFVVAEKGL
jgi:uncharacterized flavoprotein (TIGR03862 family)